MPLPRYQAVAEVLRTRIADGTYAVGERLPSIARLMTEFEVSGLNTVRHAQQLLVQEGVLSTEQGVGAWVIARTSPAWERQQVLERLARARRAIDEAIAFIGRQDWPVDHETVNGGGPK